MTTHRCPQCGAEIPGGASSAPCPACLMKLGLQTWENRLAGDAVGVMEPTQALAPEVDVPQPDELEALFPQLEIFELLGQGGMGTVFKARQKSLDRLVALKVIRPSAAADPNFSERFVREAKALAHLSHSNIVTVHDFGQAGGLYFFVMEYVDGLNLRQMLQTGRLDPSEALEIVPHVCDALQYAHDEGVVHRDIKPENILIDKKGRVKIADFGLAKILKPDAPQHSLTRTNHVMGTPHYMAPEQVEKPLSVDHRADIYSLGVVIYEMLTGELPIGRFAPPSKKAGVDVRLDKVVLRSLEKEPSLRYQSVSDVKTDMRLAGDRSADAWDASAAPQAVARSPVVDKAPVVHKPPVVKPGKPAPHEYDSGYESTSFLREALSGPFFGVIRQRQTYLNIAYLLLAFPLGTFYFVFLVTGFSVGLGLLIVWIGALILPAVVFAARALGAFERQLACKVLQTDIPHRFPTVERQGFKGRVKSAMTDSLTWTSVLYLLLKFPLGIGTFVVIVTLLSTSLGLVTAIIAAPFGPFHHKIGVWEFGTFPGAAILTMIGLFLLPISLHISNWLAWIHGRFARLCLGRNPY